MVHSSQVSPLDIRTKRGPLIFSFLILQNPHIILLYNLYFICIFRPRGEECNLAVAVKAHSRLLFMCPTPLRTCAIYHFFLLQCLLWLTLIIKVYNHYHPNYIIVNTHFTSPPHCQTGTVRILSDILFSLCFIVKEGRYSEITRWEGKLKSHVYIKMFF